MKQDTHALELMTQDGQVRSFQKAGLRHMEVQTTSGMPSYAGLLTPQEIADVVSYLQTLTASAQ
jgi:mono/diheme cytochrome c family protein